MGKKNKGERGKDTKKRKRRPRLTDEQKTEQGDKKLNTRLKNQGQQRLSFGGAKTIWLRCAKNQFGTAR